MTADALVTQIESELRAAGKPERAEQEKRYLTSELEHFGTSVPATRKVVKAILDRWATDDDFWVRRSALLALLLPLRRGGGDFARFGRYADAMLEEREFFIRKAIGWVLRDTSRKRPELVYAWLRPRVARASGVTVREAVKHLPEAQRDEILAAYRTART